MSFTQILLAATPCLVTMILGYLCLQLKILQNNSVQPVNNFLVLICFPMLLMKLITGLQLGTMNMDYVYVSVLHRILSLIIAFILGPLISRRKTKSQPVCPKVISYMTFSSLVYTNTVVIGFPMALVMFGEEALDYLTVSCSLDCVTLLPAAVIVMSDKFDIKTLSTNPIILSVILGIFHINQFISGIIFKATIPIEWIQLEPVQLIFDNFAPSVSGGLLFVIGMSFFVQTRVKSEPKTNEQTYLLEIDVVGNKDEYNYNPESIWWLLYCFVLRFVGAPLLMVVLAKYVFTLPKTVYSFALFSVTNPLSIACFGISKKYQKGVTVISNLFISTHFLMVPAFVIYAKVFNWKI
ncbi:hypothetical protein P9112_012851 [Eukaryota sp. TZLM1-RC]